MEFQDFAFRGIKRDLSQRQGKQTSEGEPEEYEHSPISVDNNSVDRVVDATGMRGDGSKGK
jgi:hypothetical protein